LLNVAPPNSGFDERPLDTRIERIAIELSQLHLLEGRAVLHSAAGERSFDVVYLALGCNAQNQLALSLNARCDEHGALIVNAHQETTVPRLYAAASSGD
jgi:thioredoxin reductase (NADPH)